MPYHTADHEARVTQAWVIARIRNSLDMWAKPHGLRVVLSDGAFDILPTDRDARGMFLGVDHITAAKHLDRLDRMYIAGGY